MKYRNGGFLFLAAVALAGCDTLGFGDGFSYKEIDDKIEGVKFVSQKMFSDKESTIAADVQFICNPSKKTISMEIGSYTKSNKKMTKNSRVRRFL